MIHHKSYPMCITYTSTLMHSTTKVLFHKVLGVKKKICQVQASKEYLNIMDITTILRINLPLTPYDSKVLIKLIDLEKELWSIHYYLFRYIFFILKIDNNKFHV